VTAAPHVDARRDDYTISSDPARLDLSVVHGYLTRSYWAAGIPEEVVRRSIEGSLCFGVYHGAAQVGFARVITDRATFGYLADVFVLEPHRGRGLSKWLVEVILAHPDLSGFRRLMLATRDAHGLYARFGFQPLAEPARWMEIRRPDVYARRAAE
jgi:GNAT superfamily N-acetyltransferase